jgi:hypothetical protein
MPSAQSAPSAPSAQIIFWPFPAVGREKEKKRKRKKFFPPADAKLH